MTYIKKYLYHLFVDGLNGLALGLFATYIWGTILQQIALYLNGFVASLLYNIGTIHIALTCAGIGIALAYKFNEDLWVTLSAAVCGIAGGHAAEILAGTLLSGSSILSSPGEPLGAFIAAYVGIEIGHLLSGRTNFDFLLTPIVTIVTGVAAGLLTAPYLSMFFKWFESLLAWGTQQSPLLMGIVVSVLMSIASILPIYTTALAASLNLTGLAAGAATAGCCCAMVGFAVSSYHENKVGGLLSQGLGTATLQLANCFRKPLVLLPILLSSAVLGPLSTLLFKTSNTTQGAGLGTLGFGAIIRGWQHMSQSHDAAIAFLLAIFVYLILPAVLTLLISNWMRKQKWIKYGDMKLDM